MTERRPDPFEEIEDEPGPQDGILPGVDLQLGGDEETAGDDNLADVDEENMYGNDVNVDILEEES